MKSVFLGHVLNNKGYLCFNLLNEKIIISKDVIFQEDDFSTVQIVSENSVHKKSENSDVINKLIVIKLRLDYDHIK